MQVASHIPRESDSTDTGGSTGREGQHTVPHPHERLMTIHNPGALITVPCKRWRGALILQPDAS